MPRSPEEKRGHITGIMVSNLAQTMQAAAQDPILLLIGLPRDAHLLRFRLVKSAAWRGATDN